MNKWKRWAREIAVLGVVTVIAAVVIGVWRAPSYDGSLPPLQATTMDGTPFDSTGVQKGAYILHFWATWCPVCRAETSSIDALAQDETIVTVAVKSGTDAQMQTYMRKNGLMFPVINDEKGMLASRFRISVFPTTIIVDKEGKVFWAESGYTSPWGLRARLWLAKTF